MSTELEKGNHMEDVLRYEGTRAVVTGAASGMGAATATILAALGAEVYDVVGVGNEVGVVFHHQYRVASLDQAVEYTDEHVYVLQVKPGCRLVKYEQRATGLVLLGEERR